MTPEIERLAKEAGPELYNMCLSHRGPLIPDLIKFAALVAEECAKECESRQTPRTGSVAILNGAADAIRAKFALSDLKDEAK